LVLGNRFSQVTLQIHIYVFVLLLTRSWTP
jgi:hypothetical protein